MNLHSDLQRHIRTVLALVATSRAYSFPIPHALADTLAGELARRVPKGKIPPSQQIELTRSDAAMFATATIDVWLCAVHSFLISASLTNVSPIWASVAGYYSSHYTVRAYAHLFGAFQLFRRKVVAYLTLDSGRYVCTFEAKSGNSREHDFYWKFVKRQAPFSADGLFTMNQHNTPASDCGHRERANYWDHNNSFPASFQPLQSQQLKSRIERLSDLRFAAPPIPRTDHFPDLDYVQLIALHRLVHFRRAVDASLGGTRNNFWQVNRDPSWARDWLDFQLEPPRDLSSEIGESS